MKVQMLKTTNYQGLKEEGKFYDVDTAAANRWIARGLAIETIEVVRENVNTNVDENKNTGDELVNDENKNANTNVDGDAKTNDENDDETTVNLDEMDIPALLDFAKVNEISMKEFPKEDRKDVAKVVAFIKEALKNKAK